MARLTLVACIVAVLVAVPFSQAKPEPSTSVAPTRYGLKLSAQLRSASSPKTFRWRVELTGSETLTQLADGSIAAVTPWPADSTDDGTDYPPETGVHTHSAAVAGARSLRRLGRPRWIDGGG